jgi:hypothetical protein
MPINATSAPKRELIPAGNYMCRCFSQVQIGTIIEHYMGEPKRQHKVMITWELPTELKTFSKEKGEQPLVISQEFTLSLTEKANLRKLLESWRGKGFTETEARNFDITKLIGVQGLMNIIHKEKLNGEMKQVISSITPVPKGMTVPKQINKSFVLSYDNFDEKAFETLPDFLKTKMRSSEEFQALYNPQTKTTDQDYEDLQNGNLEIPDSETGLPF